MRWLYHIVTESEDIDRSSRAEPSNVTRQPEPSGERTRTMSEAKSPSYTREGFVHCSFKSDVRESARLYFAGISPGNLRVLRVDPRRLDAPVRLADTPRGSMPHVHGPIPRDAIAELVTLDALDAAPDDVTGTRIAVVGFARMTLLDLAGVYDPLARISSMGLDPSARVEIVSATAEPWESGGARLTVSRVRPALEEFDVVVVAGGPETRALREDPEVIGWLGAFPRNRLIASVCTGALLLGASGRLSGKRATTHHAELASLATYGATAVAERVVDEGQLVTAGGVTAAIDLGLHIVERLYGEDARKTIAARMEWQNARC